MSLIIVQLKILGPFSSIICSSKQAIISGHIIVMKLQVKLPIVDKMPDKKSDLAS